MDEVIVKDKHELKKAMNSRAERVRVENSELASKIKIVMSLPVGVVRAGCIAGGVGVYALLTMHEETVYGPATGGVSTGIRFGAAVIAGTTTVGIMGPAAAWAFVGVGVAMGGVSKLKEVYFKYKIVDGGPDYVVLVRK